MELSKFGTSSRHGEGNIYRQVDVIREGLGETLKKVDQLVGPPPSQNQLMTDRMIQSLIKLRRNRDRFFEAELFADPAWDILLELYATELAQQRISVTSVCSGAGVPFTTALRWIGQLERKGLISRRQDPTDGRRFFVSLTPDGRQRMESYFRTVPIGSLLI